MILLEAGADEVNFSTCTMTAVPSSAYTLSPALRTFPALWPWEKNKGISFTSEFTLIPVNRKASAITVSLSLTEKTLEVKLKDKKKGTYIGALTQYLGETPAKPQKGIENLEVSFGPKSVLSKVSLTCSQTASKNVLLTESSDIQALLVAELAPECGVAVEKILTGEIVEDGETIEVSSVDADANSFSEAEIREIREKGIFYDRSPDKEDPTDLWISKFSPFIPIPQSTALNCPTVRPGATADELDRMMTDFLKEVKRVLVQTLDVPESDQKSLNLPQSLECEESLDFSMSQKDKPYEQIKDGMSRTSAQCAQRLCEEYQKAGEIRLPYRYYRSVMFLWRTDRWKELVGDSVQPFVGLSSDSNYYKDKNLDLHFVKVKKGGRPDAGTILAQIIEDRLRVPRDVAVKLAEDFAKSAEGKKALQSIAAEVTNWQMASSPAREKRSGVIRVDADWEILPVLNLKAGVIEDMFQKKLDSFDKIDVSTEKPSKTSGSKPNPKKRSPVKPTPGRVCVSGYSGKCYSKKDLVGNPSNLRDVILKSEDTAIEGNFGMTSGTKERSQLFTVKVPSDFNCDTMNADVFKNMFYKLNELYLRQVGPSYNRDITWFPGHYPQEDGSVGFEEQKKCQQELGPSRLDYCRWKASCKQGQAAGGLRAALALDSLLKSERKSAAKDYIRLKSVAVPSGEALDGELEFIAFGPEWKNLRQKYMDCYNDVSKAKCTEVKLTPDQLDLILMRSHNFSTIEEFRNHRDSQANGKYRSWYDGLLKTTSDPETFVRFLKGSFVDEGLYVMVPPGEDGVALEGISAVENPFRMANQRANGINLLRQTVADQELRANLKKSNPLLAGMYVLGLENTNIAQNFERSNAEFIRGATEYLQSWTSRPLEGIFQTLSTDGGQKALQVLSCTQAVTNPMLLATCLNGPDSKSKMLSASVTVSSFNEGVRRSLERPEGLYCAQTDLTCLETWARMGPAFIGDTGLLLLSAPLGGAGILASGLLVSARQASDAYYSTVQMELQKTGRTWEELAKSQKQSDLALRDSIISAAVKNGMLTFAVASAANLAGMKVQQMAAAKILQAELGFLNTSILAKASPKIVQDLTQRQVAVRALVGELVGGVPVNLAQATVDLVRQCKMFNQCDDEAFTSAMITSMVLMAPMSVGPGIVRVISAKSPGQMPASALKVKPDFKDAVSRQQGLEKLRSQSTLGDLRAAEGSVRYVLKNGQTEPQVMLKTDDGYGWFDLDRAVIKLDMDKNPQNFKNVKPLEPSRKISSVTDLMGVTPKKLINSVELQTAAVAESETSVKVRIALKTEKYKKKIEQIGLMKKQGKSDAELSAELQKLYKEAGEDYAYVSQAMLDEMKSSSDDLKQVLEKKPKDAKPETYDYVYIGAGIHNGIVKKSFQDSMGDGIADVKVLTLEATDNISVFGRSGDSFRGNTLESSEAGNPNTALSRDDLVADSKNYQADGGIQVADVVKDMVPVADQLQAPAVTNHWLSKSDYLFETPVQSVKEINGPQGLTYEVKMKDGRTVIAKNVVMGTGLGQERLPTKDARSIEFIKRDKGSKDQRVFFVEDLLEGISKKKKAGEDFMGQFNGSRVIVIGGGHGGAIGIEAIEGLGPKSLYTEADKNKKPDSYLWVNLDAKTGDDFKKIIGGGDRYFGLAPLIDAGKIRSNQYYVGEILPLNNGKGVKVSFIDKATGKPVLNAKGKIKYEIGDYVVYATGYDSPTNTMLSSYANDKGKVTFDPVEGNITPNDPRIKSDAPVIIANQVRAADGKGRNIYVAGPSAGKIISPTDPGGAGAVTINVFGPRSQSLGRQLAEEAKRKKEMVKSITADEKKTDR
ncbi:MAG TPA: hypothetical protein VNJ01_14195 [Bacteriovoracaceae bacterium]|nr:hypothetical protein [Bacteriovoracaceae bacterium]